MLSKNKNLIFLIISSLIISAGWSWTYTPRQPHWKFLVTANFYWLGILLGFFLILVAYKKITKNKHDYWNKFFFDKLPELFLIFSFGFLTFFCASEIVNLLLLIFYGCILFWRLNYYFKLHPTEKSWQKINKNIFIFGLFFFVIFSIIQYSAHHYYILEDKEQIHLTVLLRSLALSFFWLTGLVWAQIFSYKTNGLKKWSGILFWLLAFALCLIFWVANIGILIASGLYLSPVAIEHAAGAGQVIWNRLSIFMIGTGLSFFVLFIFILIKTHRKNISTKIKSWYYFGYTLLFFCLLTITVIAPIKKTPEAVVLTNFYNYYFKKEENINLSPTILEKLKKQFGIDYKIEEFYLNRKEKIFQEEKKLLPEKFYQHHPNIIIIFVESLSSSLTNAYDQLKIDLTPNLKKFAEEKNTTIFKNYFNASTPTVTGILAQLCSFLPPTGHEEINAAGHWTKFYLRCLPEILNTNAGYKDSAYITAVEKNYANKSTIYESIGVKKTFGTEELYDFIPGKPLGWGWTDHQMFLALPKIMNQMSEPFLFMFSTVDTHAPYNLPKDLLNYADGKNNILNSYYTTDDAFGKFWSEFKKSSYYENSITIVVGDHAIFPSPYKSIPEYQNNPKYTELSYYDENAFLMHIPGNILPKQIDTYSSSIDFAPTLLHLLNISTSTTFEGHSIFDDRKKYPNLLGMHEFGLYINQESKGGRKISYDLPSNLQMNCPKNLEENTNSELTLCEFEQFYKWKRQMLEQGRLWFK